MKKVLCYLPDNHPQDLDHLVPLALELDLQIITHSETKYALVKEYYPDAKISYTPPSHPFQEMQDSPALVSTLPRSELELELFLELALFGPFESIFCHHGLSDKQQKSNQFKNLHKDTKVLVYGNKMQQEIPSHCKTFCTGNYRKHHFAKKSDNYSIKVEQVLKNYNPNKWTVLFAPSWVQKNINHGFTIESLGSFLEGSLLSPILKDIQVLFKPHPYLFTQIPETLEKIKRASAGIANLIYLEEIPYIYPLLNLADAYLGDVSSIGYDFLTTQKPVFTLAKEHSSAWQEIALPAPIKDGKVDWPKLFTSSKFWDQDSCLQLLQESFAPIKPLSDRKEAFFEFISITHD